MGPDLSPGTTLGQALKIYRGVAGTGGEAKVLIQFGEVLVNGEIEDPSRPEAPRGRRGRGGGRDVGGPLTAYLRALRLVNFRNYADETVLLSPGLNVIVGENARGKTNLLEAISFAATGSTPRTAKENEVVRWDEDFCPRRGPRISWMTTNAK